MRVTVIGATGMVGSRVTDEALHRDHQVTAVSRNPVPRATPAAVRWVAADAQDDAVLIPLITGTDALVLSVRPAPGSGATLTVTTEKVLDAAAKTAIPVLVVGGAGPLRSPDRPGLLVADNRTYVPAEWSALAAGSTDQLRACQRHPTADWTYLSPPALLVPGTRTGTYRRGADTLLVDAAGLSQISVEDFAIAVLDELESPSGDRHLTVAY